ncbi:MAG TPA: DegT/DnrJ/EryC1/StrS family aminotransferase, partial [Puia sp.]|nr:DegT/DnrJ/EryC1/StrS family aminotransferase [Puia sp.]
MINVTKTFLPPFAEYTNILKRAWDKSWVTNNGELLIELESKLKTYLGLKNLLFCNNGTIVLQMALKALQIKGEVITTPFSYVATTSAILWENCVPVFVDIDKMNFCIDPSKIEAAITSRTQAILATHVFGYPCDVEAVDGIAKKNGLKVIYDAAHAFGSMLAGRSLLDYGDISTCSFHATKLFHTGEGGCIVANSDELNRQLFLYRQFGHVADDYYSMGINGKNSEFHAAMGLCNLKYIDEIRERRKSQWLYYKMKLQGSGLQMLEPAGHVQYNYAYFPVVFPSEGVLLQSIGALKEKEIIPRRYFYPALNKLPYVDYQLCSIAESVARRVMCLPLFHDLAKEDQDLIIELVL